MHELELAYRKEINRLSKMAHDNAQTKDIAHERVRRYAEFWAYAKQMNPSGPPESDKQTRALNQGARYGYSGGDHLAAEKAVRKGREMQQQLHAKIKSLRAAMRRLDLAGFYLNHRDELRLDLQCEPLPSMITELAGYLDRIALRTSPPSKNPLRFTFVFTKSGNPPEPRPIKPTLKNTTPREQALIWWHYCVDRYDGEWDDVFALAELWKLTAGKSKSSDNFRRQVLLICQKKTTRENTADGEVIWIMPPPPPTHP